MTELVKKLTLADYAMEVERMCAEVDACEGEIPSDVIQRFETAELALAEKCDRWIGLLDAVKSRSELLKEHKERVQKAIKATDGVQERLKSYLKHTMQAFPDLPYKGSSGRLALQKNPESLKIHFETKDVTVYRTLEKSMLSLEPGLNAYVKEITLYVIETDKLKADLKAGMKMYWAELTQDSHVRVRA